MHSSGKTTIELAQFIPYFNDTCLQIWPKLLAELQPYSKVCASYAQWGLQKCAKQLSESINGTIFEQIVSKQQNVSVKFNESQLKPFMLEAKYSLIQLMQKIFDLPQGPDWGMNVKNLLASAELESDLLWPIMHNKHLYKPLVDLLIENTPGHLLRIVEVEAKNSAFILSMKEAIELNPLVETDIYIIGPDAEDRFEIDDEGTNASKFAGICSVNLDQPEFTVPDKYKHQDMVVLDCVLHHKIDVLAYLDRLRTLLRDDGFLIINEVIN